MTSITCECGGRVEFDEITNSWYDVGLLLDNEEAVYFAECDSCGRIYKLHQFKPVKKPT